ncbi:hypothetical protein RI543_000392 [Arxiozyma heterogenica]|uniref:Uncharacterized protein n=1 Tax=Arxiozyma heterogenica TaxID=278026 RepID=A0AAN8A9U4_9SACH|nr:hypothetical protein RI543_000392 [Kazachstania heterogenica]
MTELEEKKYIKFKVAATFMILGLLSFSFALLGPLIIEISKIREMLDDKMRSENLNNIHALVSE